MGTALPTSHFMEFFLLPSWVFSHAPSNFSQRKNGVGAKEKKESVWKGEGVLMWRECLLSFVNCPIESFWEAEIIQIGLDESCVQL